MNSSADTYGLLKAKRVESIKEQIKCIVPYEKQKVALRNERMLDGSMIQNADQLKELFIKLIQLSTNNEVTEVPEGDSTSMDTTPVTPATPTPASATTPATNSGTIDNTISDDNEDDSGNMDTTPAPTTTTPATNSDTIDDTISDDNEDDSSNSITTILLSTEFKKMQESLSDFYSDTRRNRKRTRASNWSEGDEQKLMQLVGCFDNERRTYDARIISELLYHLYAIGPYSTRTISGYLKKIRPNNNTTVVNDTSIDDNADVNNTTTVVNDTNGGTGSTGDIPMDVVDDTSDVNSQIIDNTSDASQPIDTIITLHNPEKQTKLSDSEKLLCWLATYTHHNIDRNNDLQRFPWSDMIKGTNANKLRILNANKELDLPYSVVPPKLNENTEYKKYSEFFKGQKKTLVARSVNINWKDWIVDNVSRSCDQFIHKYNRLAPIINQIRQEILQ